MTTNIVLIVIIAIASPILLVLYMYLRFRRVPSKPKFPKGFFISW